LASRCRIMGREAKANDRNATIGTGTDKRQWEMSRTITGFLVINCLAATALQVTPTLRMHHRDPFERMWVARALTEETTLVSRDPIIAAYPVPTITA